MTTSATLTPEVRQAVERLSRLDKLGALGAEEAADVRTLLDYVDGGARALLVEAVPA